MPEVVTRWIPGYQIPKRWHYQHRLRLNHSYAFHTFRITLIELQMLALKKGYLDFGKQGGVHCANVGSAPLRC